MPQSVGSILREARKRLKLDQEEAAEQVGVTRTTVSNHERGATVPDGQLLSRYAQLYGLPMHTLMDAAGEAPPIERMSQMVLIAMFAILLHLAQKGVDEEKIEALHARLLDPAVRARLAALPVGETEEERIVMGMRFLASQLQGDGDDDDVLIPIGQLRTQTIGKEKKDQPDRPTKRSSRKR